ncbi:GYF domain-containing protein [Xanthomonas maliensis]|uniref:GYF domain-containing protein n=1 Tax=Xanthomonas maliensis TaxID=1321368 RepID=UPI00039A16D4|nr:GYF domain-containing protein [Xanthomonas maliensis]
MNGWYYADGQRQRRGPVASDALVELYRDGAIALDTLVWCEGMPHWQPLSAHAQRLGPPLSTDLAMTSRPPPLPTAGPVPTPIAPSTNGPNWPLLLIIGAVVGVFGLAAIAGILGAIAIPAYSSYLERAQINAAVTQLRQLQAPIAESFAQQGRCPSDGEDGFSPHQLRWSAPIDTVEVGRFDTANCGIEAVLKLPRHAKVDGKRIWLELDVDSGQWQCSSEIDDTLLPPQCRG